MQAAKTKEEIEEEFIEDFMRMMTHAQYTQIAIDIFRRDRLLRENPRLSNLRRHALEALNSLRLTERKLKWFIGVAKKILGPANSALLDKELDPQGHKLNNIAQLTQWVILNKRDLTREVEIFTIRAKHMEETKRIWQMGMESTVDRPWTDQDEQRFTSWYNANYPPTT